MTPHEQQRQALEQTLRQTRLLTPAVLRMLAAALAEEGYRRERHSRWLADPSFVSRQSKVRYQCARCGYWRVCKRRNESRMLRALRFCPQCGAAMAVPSERSGAEEGEENEGNKQF